MDSKCISPSACLSVLGAVTWTGGSVCLVCFVCVGTRVFTVLCEMEKAGRNGFAQGGSGCTLKNEQRLSLGPCLHFIQLDSLKGGGGGLGIENRGYVYITYAAGK